MGGGDNDVAAVAKVISINKSHSQDGTPLRTNATPQIVNKYVVYDWEVIVNQAQQQKALILS